MKNNALYKKPPRGSIKLPLWLDKHYIVHGGSFLDAPDGMKGVKLAREIRQDCAVDLEIKDFGVPSYDKTEWAVYRTLQLIARGEPVYVGCMGGVGRTGMFLAILAKCFDIARPVSYVRKHYLPYAVETAEQVNFVAEFVPSVRIEDLVFEMKIKSVFKLRKNLTNLPN